MTCYLNQSPRIYAIIIFLATLSNTLLKYYKVVFELIYRNVSTYRFIVQHRAEHSSIGCTKNKNVTWHTLQRIGTAARLPSEFLFGTEHA